MNTHHFSITVLITLLASVTQFAIAAPSGKSIATQGNKNGATACIACHGPQGMGNKQAGYPYLAGLPSAYIERQLTNFQNGNRQNAIMIPIAKKLSAAEITAVADYYSTLNNDVLSKSDPGGQTQNKLGLHLFEKGKWSAGVPACAQCHGPNGTGIGTQFPPIIGQPYDYTRKQLSAWQEGKRKGDPVGLMHSVASHLDDSEIEALAHFLAMQ